MKYNVFGDGNTVLSYTTYRAPESYTVGWFNDETDEVTTKKVTDIKEAEAIVRILEGKLSDKPLALDPDFSFEAHSVRDIHGCIRAAKPDWSFEKRKRLGRLLSSMTYGGGNDKEETLENLPSLESIQEEKELNGLADELEEELAIQSSLKFEAQTETEDNPEWGLF